MAAPGGALGGVPGGAGLHRSQSLEGTAGNWAGGPLPGQMEAKCQKHNQQNYLSVSSVETDENFVSSCYLLHRRAGRLCVAIVTALAMLLNLPGVQI